MGALLFALLLTSGPTLPLRCAQGERFTLTTTPARDYDCRSGRWYATTSGVAGGACPANQYATSISTNGVPTCAALPAAGGSAPASDTFITQTPSASLSAEQALSALGTGLVKNTTGTGVLSIYAGSACSAGQVATSLNASGALACTATPTLTTVTAALAGNATTATALAANGGNCSAGSFPLGVDASGAVESCTVAFTSAGVPAAETDAAHDTCAEIGGCVVGAITSSGNAATATALDHDPTDCSAGQVATGIGASGALVCTASPTLTTVTAALSGNASTASALAADGANCSAGQIPLGVDTAGAVQGCYTPTSSTVSLGSVTNDAQTKAAVVPNTAPSSGQLLVGNAGGTAYAPQSMSQDCTMTSAGVVTCLKTNNVSFATSATTDTTTPTYITETASGNLSAEFAMGSLGSGLVLNTTTTGVPSIYGGTSCTNQFPRSVNASGAATCASVATTDLASQAARSVLGNATAASAVPTATTTVDALAYQTAEVPAFVRVSSSDFTTAANTNLQAITGLTWTVPANTALNLPFSCHLMYSIATAAVAVSFGIQDVSVAPTNIAAQGHMYTSATASTEGTLATLSTTTATAIVTATPSAVTTVWKADLFGMIEAPSNASSSAITIMVKTATAADVVSVKRGSFCTVGF